MPLDPEQVVEGMRQYQRLLRDLLERSDWQTHDKNGNPLERPFLKKPGWRKIARAFNLSFERVSSAVERARTANTATATATAQPTRSASRAGRDDRRSRTTSGAPQRRGPRTAPPPTWSAWVRCPPKEIVQAGDEDEQHQAALSAGAPASEDLGRVAFAALAHLLGGGEPDREAARRVGERIAADHDYLPVAVGRALCYAATARSCSGTRTGDRSRHPRPAELLGTLALVLTSDRASTLSAGSQPA